MRKVYLYRGYVKTMDELIEYLKQQIDGYSEWLRLPQEVKEQALEVAKQNVKLFTDLRKLALASIYITAKSMGVKISQQQLSDASGLSVVTIRKAIRKLKRKHTPITKRIVELLRHCGPMSAKDASVFLRYPLTYTKAVLHTLYRQGKLRAKPILVRNRSLMIYYVDESDADLI